MTRLEEERLWYYPVGSILTRRGRLSKDEVQTHKRCPGRPGVLLFSTAEEEHHRLD